MNVYDLLDTKDKIDALLYYLFMLKKIGVKCDSAVMDIGLFSITESVK